MFQIILTIHILLSLGLIGLVLVQQGKGADMGAAFGSGNANTVFGASGATGLLTKATTSLVIAFMITSILLVRAYNAKGPAVQVSNDLLAGSTIDVEEVGAGSDNTQAASENADTKEATAAAAVAVDNGETAKVPATEEEAK